MIPSDVASRMQVSADTALRQVAPAQEISDKLSGLVAGQKVMAEIQSLLPNGTYRALINQRNVTLALPFSAKSGDALELQVTESDGKLALAVVSRQDGGEANQPAAASTTATLSRTGQLISTLISAASEAEGGPAALPLNANQPISAAPAQAQDLAPLLKQAITQSGMFYESHQAEWVEGRLPTSALLQEPQGKLSSPSAFSNASADEQNAALALKAPATTTEQTAKAAPAPAGGERATEVAASPRAAADALQSNSVDATKAGTAHLPEQAVAPQTQGVVAQQLEALATQNFSWQGQIWPGQEMRWEIEEDASHRRQDGDETAENWSTRLRLILPKLGEIDAQIRLQGNQISLAMHADNADTRALLRTASAALRGQLDDAGLTLAAIGVDAVSQTDGQVGQ
jgi:flagellar hook-length control protein FliK